MLGSARANPAKVVFRRGAVMPKKKICCRQAENFCREYSSALGEEAVQSIPVGITFRCLSIISARPAVFS